MTLKLSRAMPEDWNQIIASLPRAHILQTREWGEVKSEYGWRPNSYLWKNDQNQVLAAAMVLERTVASRLRVLYIPKGPLLDWGDEKNP